MSQSELEGSQRGSVLLLSLNRPAVLNALNSSLISELTTVLECVEVDPGVSAVILTGTGRAFSAGADLIEFERAIADGPQFAIGDIVRPGQALTRRIESYRKPVITAVNGLAFGGGCEIVEASHISISAENALFSKAEINIGIMPVFGGTQRLPRLVGRKRAIEMILMGDPIDAKTALSYGLINRVTSSDVLLDEAFALAERLASKNSFAVAAALDAVTRGSNLSIDDGLSIEASAFEGLACQADAGAGIREFLADRAVRRARE